MSSSSLAFTGPGKGVGWAARLGGLLLLLGLVLLAAASAPRRWFRRPAYAGLRSGIPAAGGRLARRIARAGHWMLGR